MGRCFYLFVGDGLFLLFYFDAMLNFYLYLCYLVLIARGVLNYKLVTPGLSRLQYRLTILNMSLFTVFPPLISSHHHRRGHDLMFDHPIFNLKSLIMNIAWLIKRQNSPCLYKLIKQSFKIIICEINWRK